MKVAESSSAEMRTVAAVEYTQKGLIWETARLVTGAKRMAQCTPTVVVRGGRSALPSTRRRNARRRQSQRPGDGRRPLRLVAQRGLRDRGRVGARMSGQRGRRRYGARRALRGNPTARETRTQGGCS